MKKNTILISLFLGIVGQINAQNFWTEIERPVDKPVYAMAVTNTNTVYLGMGMDSGVFVSLNENYNWDLHGLDGLSVYSLHIDPNGIVLAGTGGEIYMLAEVENSWELIFDSIYNVVALSSDFDGNIYASYAGIIKTTDYGNNWEQVFSLIGTNQWVTDIFCQEYGVIYAGIISFMTDAGGVYRSFDYGETWEYAGLSGYYIKTLACDSNGNLYAGSAGNYGIGIYRSQDQGLTWTGLKNDVFVESIVITPDDHIYIGCSNEYGTQGGVFVSTDYGDTWEMINTGLNNENVYGLSYAPNGYLYAYGNHLHRSQNPVCSKIETQTNSNQEFMVFPNPVTDYLQIKSQTNHRSTGPVTVKMLDMYGRLVCSENNYISNSRVDVSGLDDGVYLLLIEAENKRFEQRIVKIK